MLKLRVLPNPKGDDHITMYTALLLIAPMVSVQGDMTERVRDCVLSRDAEDTAREVADWFAFVEVEEA